MTTVIILIHFFIMFITVLKVIAYVATALERAYNMITKLLPN